MRGRGNTTTPFFGKGDKGSIYGLTIDMQVHVFISRFLLRKLQGEGTHAQERRLPPLRKDFPQKGLKLPSFGLGKEK